jgi:hypothetical protein
MSAKEAALLLKSVENGTLPARVFKYRDLGPRTMEIFEKASLWFATAQSFNDPFDCNLSETYTHTLSEYQSYLDTQPFTPTERIAVEKLSHTRPDEVRNICIKARNGAVNSRGILALASINDNILLWSHYTRDHTGLVLGFDMTLDPEFFLTPYTVKYEDSYAELNYFRNREETITRNISTKSLDWAYEKEIRIVKQSSQAWEFKRECLREIYFGCKASATDIAKVRDLCSSNSLSHVQFFKGEMVHGKFALNFLELR